MKARRCPSGPRRKSKAHIAFQQALVGKELADNGQLVRAGTGLAGPEVAKFVTFGGPGAAPVVTDGPCPETKEFLAGYYLVATSTTPGRGFSTPSPPKRRQLRGPDGDPIYERIEIRQVMGAPDPDA